MWTDKKFSFDTRIVERVRQYADSKGKSYINLATIKNRYSNTIGNSYLSFGCKDCDAFFGDFFVNDVILESYYGGGVIDSFSFESDSVSEFTQNIPYWCHPGHNEFCE